MTRAGWERRGLQAAVLLAGFVPVIGGAAGVFLGPSMLADGAGDITLDSHFRYLSGLLLAIGLAFWWMIPGIERHGTMFRLLTGVVVLGGLGRLFGMIMDGLPAISMIAGLGMELVVTPALCLAQARVARGGSSATGYAT